jgi:uncharacterized protein YegP (UPF0339 family)
MAREPEFKILKNTEGEYYWHLEAADSRVVAWSGQAYVIKQACVNDLLLDQGQRIADHDPRLHRGVVQDGHTAPVTGMPPVSRSGRVA